MTHLLLTIALLVGSSLISLIDIREHRIHNSHLLFFAFPLLLESRTLPILESFIMVTTTLVFSISLRIGGGDFKLFSLLIISQGQLVISREYFQLMAFFLGLSLLLTTLLAIKRNQRLGGSIPLAPSILAPFIAIYLDI